MKVQISDHFMDRLYGEFQAFKAEMLALTNRELFGRCYEVDIKINLYEIMMEKAGGLTAETLSVLLKQKNILACLYDGWLKKDDSQYGELESHVVESIGYIADRCRREAA